jgi:proteasome accessory factor B
MSRLERLVNLTAALLNAERPLTADAIRKRVSGYPTEKSAFRRQFERDKDALRELGLPLVTHGDSLESPATYTVDRENYYVRDPGLTPDELSALTMAAEVVRLSGLGDQRLDDAIWKLDGQGKRDRANTSTPSADRETIESINALAINAELPADETVAAIFDAIASGKEITFSYREQSRHVVPRSLSFENGRWYVAAFDLQRADERSFRIDRIAGGIVLGNQPAKGVVPEASPKSNPSRAPWEQGEGEAVHAVVHVSPAHAPWAERHVGSQAVTQRNNDGSIVLGLTVRNRDAFRSFLFGFLDGAQVIGPPELRTEVVTWLRTKATATT